MTVPAKNDQVRRRFGFASVLTNDNQATASPDNEVGVVMSVRKTKNGPHVCEVTWQRNSEHEHTSLIRAKYCVPITTPIHIVRRDHQDD